VLTLPSSVRIYVAAEAVDLRRGFDGLAAATRGVIRQDSLNGHLFVLLNRRRNRIELLVWDRTGYLLLYKRLERGTFHLPAQPQAGHRHVELDAGDLGLITQLLTLIRKLEARRKHLLADLRLPSEGLPGSLAQSAVAAGRPDATVTRERVTSPGRSPSRSTARNG